MTIDTTYHEPVGEEAEWWEVQVKSAEGDDQITVNLTFTSEPSEALIKAWCLMFGLTDDR